MNTTRLLTVAAVLFAAGAAAQADTGYDQYRRTVLGDTTIAAPAVATRTAVVPGSYAQYLINNGSDKSVALVTAAHVGETPVRTQVAVQTPRPVLSPLQAYVKSLGNDGFGVRANEAVGNAE
ncbi:hypothetical protein [Pelomonas sp. KK5]|uniref:hypothetical protein n=1 Tax=Pelomonas sp. KK5 TaxID=1855730 RepID=UPI00097CA558|nr:hypothetical protein [Pelomonas sp. KK5]